MKVKETIAFVGEVGGNYIHLVHRLATEKYPLVFVTEGGKWSSELPDQIRSAVPYADIENRDCIKEGCWEADIIAFPDVMNLETETAKKIKEVCTQKILAYFTEGKKGTASATEGIRSLQQSLPDSRVTGLIYNPAALEINILGNDEEATTAISDIFTGMGYKTMIRKVEL